MKKQPDNRAVPMSAPACPVPPTNYENILLAHGGGGKLTADLIEKLFLPAFGDPALDERHDGAEINIGRIRLAMTTDSFVVTPLFFPGGDIGRLAVYGTLNDLAMCGARPLFLSAAFIIEEGLPLKTVHQVADSMGKAAKSSGIRLITGDTKVIERKSGNDLFVTTTGIGIIEHGLKISPQSIMKGDKIILSGDIGRHGTAVMACREGFEFETTIESDCAPLWNQVEIMLRENIEIHCLRDLTRGGLATALVEIAETSGLRLEIEESLIPVSDQVAGACEILGLDPLYVANEGRFICFVPEKQAGAAIGLLRQSAPNAAIIGQATDTPKKDYSNIRVVMKTPLGTSRIIDRITGDQLPRIC